MPALTVKAVTKALSEYVRPDEDLVAKLNLVMPRLYGMGMWKDLLYDHSIDTTNDYFALPEHSESLLGAMLQDSPVQARSQWHDYRISGYAKSGPAPIFGVVDDGFHEAKEDLVHKTDTDVYYIVVEPIAPKTTLPTTGSVTVVYGEETDFAVGEDDVESHTFDLNGTASLSTLVNKVVSIKSVSFADVSEEVKVSAVASNGVGGSQLTFELIGTDLGEPANLKWRGIAKAGNKLYATPYIDANILIIDPSNDTTSEVVNPVTQNGTQKYVDSLTASNGKVYANPNSAFNYLEITDGGSGSPTIAPRPSTVIKLEDGTNGHTNIRGGAEANGHIYGTIYSRTVASHANPFVSKFSLTSPYRQKLLSFTPSRTGGMYDVRNSSPNNTSNSADYWKTLTADGGDVRSGYDWIYDSYFGATKATNGKVYLTPYGADRVAIVDPSDDSITLGDDLLTGNEPYITGSQVSTLSDTDLILHAAYFNKYHAGTFVSSTGCIYCFPRHGNAILKIDTSDDSAVEIPLPSALRIYKATYSGVDFYKNKSYSSVLGPDGLVYSVPYEIPYIFWIDPATDEIGYREISDELQGTGSTVSNTATDSWYSYGITEGNSIYMAPQKANYVMKMSFPSTPEVLEGGDRTARRLGGDTSSTTTLAVVKGDGVARYRRFRFSNPSAEVKNIKLLLKRAWEPVLVQDDLIYLGNLNAIKHGLLGMLAEDNADLERAQYHWTICQKLLDEELDAARGAAKPRLSLDPSGSGSAILNII